MTVSKTMLQQSAVPLPAIPRIDRATAWCVGILAVCMLAWITALIVMADMDQGPGTPLHDFPTFLIGWVIMLTAMMLPSEVNYVKAYAVLLEDRAGAQWDRFVSVVSFIAGYGVAWVAYGILAFVLDAVVRESASDIISWYQAGPLLAGSVLFLAGVYQVSPLKQACLTHCRAPISYFARHWRPGGGGALRMGLLHGLVCVGCCWALMAVMFAVGAMSLIWMGLLALLMFAEKVFPYGHKLALPMATVLWAMGIWIAFSPDTAPLLQDPFLFGSAICRVS